MVMGLNYFNCVHLAYAAFVWYLKTTMVGRLVYLDIYGDIFEEDRVRKRTILGEHSYISDGSKISFLGVP